MTEYVAFALSDLVYLTGILASKKKRKKVFQSLNTLKKIGACYRKHKLGIELAMSQGSLGQGNPELKKKQ